MKNKSTTSEKAFLVGVSLFFIAATAFYMIFSHDAQSVWNSLQKSVSGSLYAAVSLVLLIVICAAARGKKGYRASFLTFVLVFVWSTTVCIPILMALHFENENPFLLSPFLVVTTILTIRSFNLGIPGVHSPKTLTAIKT
jgi:type IV secretory pathway VirB2 component (pilin)